MPNQETSVEQYRNGANTSGALSTSTSSSSSSHRKASFIENLTPNIQAQSASRKNSHGAPPVPVKEEIIYRSKSLQLSELTFSDCHGNHKSAEVIHKHFDPRTLMPQTYARETTEIAKTGAAAAAVQENPEGILSIAILKRHILCDCLILVKKYRPSLKSFVLEFPAKIVEHNSNGTGSEHQVTVATKVPVDGNESDTSVGDAAVRDVEENTGYKSTQVKWVSPDTAVDPGKLKKRLI